MIVRIAQFAFKPGTEEQGVVLLRDHVAFLARSPGCRRAFLAAPIHGTAHLVYGEWESESEVDSVEAALRSNPEASSSFFGLMGMLQSPPHIARFEVFE